LGISTIYDQRERFMSSSVEKSSGTQLALSSQVVVYGGIAWAVISLTFFLIFSLTAPGQESPLWYLIGTYVLETLPFLIAAWLCYRNWRSPTIASGRNVWLGIGLGMLSWFIANLIFGWWELSLGLDPDVSPADLFYLGFYLFLGWGMVLAVLPRRLNLETWQWITVGVIAVIGIGLAIFILLATPETSRADDATPLSAQTEQTAPEGAASQPNTAQTAPLLTANSTEQSTSSRATHSPAKQPPAWAVNVENFLSPLSRPVNFFYIVGDVFLLIIASTLLLAFWGGRFAQSWRMIAAATFSLYIADMWFKYEDATAVEYESGSLLEVFFVFSGVLFAIGAALEYDVSSRSRRSTRRRT
jgi:hypothetical protein